MLGYKNLFFGPQIENLKAWELEIKAQSSLPNNGDKKAAMLRFVSDCDALATTMEATLDPSLCDTVDLNARYTVLEVTRRRLINALPSEETPL